MFYRNFELIFEFKALKRAPICGQKVCLAFFLSIFVSNGDNFNKKKKMKRIGPHAKIMYNEQLIL